MIVLVFSKNDLNYMSWFLNQYRIEYRIAQHTNDDGLKEWMIFVSQEIPDLQADLECKSKIFSLG